MKTKLFTILSVCILSAFAVPAIPAFAEEGDGERKGERRPPRGERPDFSSMTAEEKLEALKKRLEKHPKLAEMLKKRFDEDEDGSLSDGELAAAAKSMGKRRAFRAGRRLGAKGEKGRKRGRGPHGKGRGKGPRGRGPRGSGDPEE